jgi:hypothetical protein
MMGFFLDHPNAQSMQADIFVGSIVFSHNRSFADGRNSVYHKIISDRDHPGLP